MPKNNHYTLSFQDAKKIVHSYGLKNHPEYSRFMNSSKRPVNLPKAPHYIYKDQWVSWPDFLGVKQMQKPIESKAKKKYNIKGSAKTFLPYEKAKEIIQSYKFKSHKEYKLWSKTKRPSNIPGQPDEVYKNQFEGWGVYFGRHQDQVAQQMPDLFVEKTNPQPVKAQIEQPVILPQLPKLHAISKIVEEIEAEKRAEEIYQRANRLSGFLKEFDELAEKSMQGWRNAYINYLASLAFKHENQKRDLHPTRTLDHAVNAAIKNPVTATLMISLETCAKNEYGKCAQSAVMPSTDVTALNATVNS